MEQTMERETLERRMLRRAAAAGRPVTGTLELTPLCNMRCGMCYIRLEREEMERLGGLRTAEEWLQLGREMAEAGVLFLLLTGGEPLLFPGFRELYAGLRRMGFILTVNTNGTLLDEDWADFFAQNRPRRVNITLYGADETAYATLCHHPGGFESAVRAIRLLRARGIDVKINGSVTKQNLADMRAIYALGRELGAPVHMDTYMIPGLHERELPPQAQSRLTPEDAARAEICMMREEQGEEALRSLAAIVGALSPGSYPDGLVCMAGRCSFAVDWRGSMRPCVTLSEPAAPVFETGFSSAWAQIAAQAQKLRVARACVECALRPLCKTCAASAKLETGRYDGVPAYLCCMTRALAAQLGRLAEEDTDG